MKNPSTKVTLQNSFAVATPRAFERAGGSTDIALALASIERRADAIKHRVAAHATAFQDRWTAREAIRLWKGYLASQDRYPGPPNAVQDIVPDAVLKTAARHVAARTQARLAKVNAIKMRTGNALIRLLETRSLAQRASPRRNANTAGP